MNLNIKYLPENDSKNKNGEDSLINKWKYISRLDKWWKINRGNTDRC